MQIPINTEPLKALDVPTRWLLSTALDEAAHLADLVRTSGSKAVNPDELKRKAEVYREIAEAMQR